MSWLISTVKWLFWPEPETLWDDTRARDFYLVTTAELGHHEISELAMQWAAGDLEAEPVICFTIIFCNQP
jgi:hypothetical protein